jgi:hypothetical protein
MAFTFRVEEKAKQAQFCLPGLFNYQKMEAVCSSETVVLLDYTVPHLRRSSNIIFLQDKGFGHDIISEEIPF